MMSAPYSPPLSRPNETNPRVCELSSVDRPREKLLTRGPGALTDVELLSVLLGSGTHATGVLDLSNAVLSATDGKLAAATVELLQGVRGVGPAKACQVVASMELGRRHLNPRRTAIREADDVLPYLASIRQERQEHFVCLSLNGAHEVLATRVVTVGLLNSNQVHPREVFADPITDRAAAIIVAHNHPSGTLEPSPEDLAITRRLLSAGELLGIRVLDHLIVTRDGLLSLRQTGRM
jgi:DNA repair protein RadC